MRTGIFLFCILLTSCGGSSNSNTPQPNISDTPTLTTGWLQIPLPTNFSNIKAIRVYPENPTRIILLTNPQIDNDVINIYYSDDHGQNWSKDEVGLLDYDNQSGEDIQEILDPTDSEQLYFTTRPVVETNSTLLNPTIRLRSYSFDAHVAELISDGTNARFKRVNHHDDSSRIYRSTLSNSGGPGSLKISHDEGQSFTNIGSSFPLWDLSPAGVDSLLDCQMNLLSATIDGRIAVDCDGLFISNNEGEDWQQVPLNLNSGTITLTNAYTLTFDPFHQTVTHLFDKQNQTLYRNDGSPTWDQRSLPEGVVSLSFSQSKEDFIYAAAGPAGAYFSINGGLTWEPLEGETGELNIVEIHSAQEELYLITDLGVHYWQPGQP